MVKRKTTAPCLPKGFESLEPFVDAWALPTEAARTARRHASPMTEINKFYAAMLERLDDALNTLDGVALEALSPEQKRLHYLTLSLCEVAPAVELYKQPAVIDGFDPARFPRVDIAHMTPQEG